jgi:hypothetical protein
MKRVAARLGSMIGTAVMVLIALTSFEVVLQRRDRQARQNRYDRLLMPPMVPASRRDHPVYGGPRVIPDRNGVRVHKVR